MRFEFIRKSDELDGGPVELLYKFTSFPAQMGCTLQPTQEDVFMEILRGGGSLTIKDVEGEGDMTRSIYLKDVHERVQKVPLDELNAMIEEQYDASTAGAVLQTVFFEGIIFG